jgi:CBS domain-containing protein
MHTEVVTVTPETLTTDAVRIMRENKVSCLPVVRDGKLVGLVTERDFLRITEELMEEKLSRA